MHSHHYRDPFEPYDFRGKRVMVVGAGNSAMDISSELSQRPIAEQLFISMRHGVWVLPKYFDGKPADKASLPPWMPAKVGRALARGKIKKSIGKMEDYGLPKPDHRPLDAHPSVSGEFLTRVGCGDITPKGAIDRLDGDGVVFTDGSREQIDAIVWATGYNVTFPFFRQPELTPQDNTFPLFKRMVKPGFENLFFLGLAQPLPTLVNFAEQQSKLVAAAISGRYAFPSASPRWTRSPPPTRRSTSATSTTAPGIACRSTSTPTSPICIKRSNAEPSGRSRPSPALASCDDQGRCP